MNNKHRYNLVWYLNDEKLKEQIIKLRYGPRGVPFMTNEMKE